MKLNVTKSFHAGLSRYSVQAFQTGQTEKKISRSHSNRRDPAVINPVEVIEGGEDVLREKLDNLTEKELKDIIAYYGMDSTKLSMKWKKRDRLINFIIETSVRRASKGDAFR